MGVVDLVGVDGLGVRGGEDATDADGVALIVISSSFLCVSTRLDVGRVFIGMVVAAEEVVVLLSSRQHRALFGCTE